MSRKLHLTLWLMLASACQDSVNRFPVDAGSSGGGGGGATGGGGGASVGGGSGGGGDPQGGGGGALGGGAGGGTGGGSTGGGGGSTAGGGGGTTGGGSGGATGSVKADDVISGAGHLTGGTFVMDAQVGQGTPQAPATGGGRVIQGNTAIKR